MPEAPHEQTGYTAREYEILEKVKLILPAPFLEHESDEITLDKKILAYAELVINDINYVPPATAYTLQNFPAALDTILILGINAFTMLFMQAKWTMNDFSYTDNGLSLSLDRVEKLDRAYKNFYDLYKQKTIDVKNQLMLDGIVVLGTPRYTNMLGNFIRVAFGIFA